MESFELEGILKVCVAQLFCHEQLHEVLRAQSSLTSSVSKDEEPTIFLHYEYTNTLVVHVFWLHSC